MRTVPLDRPWKGHQLYRFWIFKFYSWIFKKTSKFWAASCKNKSNLLLVRKELYRILSSYWLAHFYLIKKNRPKCCSVLVWITGCWNSLLTSRSPKNNWCLSLVFGAWFGRKDCGLSTCKPWSKQAGGWIHFLHEVAQNSELLSNIQNKK